jgi:nitrite reductase/ring-hydroxylating ferredoxin subunit
MAGDVGRTQKLLTGDQQNIVFARVQNFVVQIRPTILVLIEEWLGDTIDLRISFFHARLQFMTPPDDDSARNTISRRTFLGGTALVVLPTLCGGCTSERVQMIDLPAVANNAIVLPLDEFPELAAVGGSVVGKASGHATPIVIAHVEDGKFAVLDATCTHMQCTVTYNALNLTLDCPCHHSTFEVDGRVIGGPAVRPLRAFGTNFDGTNLTITLA